MIYQLMKCAYCRKKRIYPVNKIESQDGLMFCSVKCRNRFMWLLSNHGSGWRTYFKNKFKCNPKPKDIKITKKESNRRAKEIIDRIDEKILNMEYGEYE